MQLSCRSNRDLLNIFPFELELLSSQMEFFFSISQEVAPSVILKAIDRLRKPTWQIRLSKNIESVAQGYSIEKVLNYVEYSSQDLRKTIRDRPEIALQNR